MKNYIVEETLTPHQNGYTFTRWECGCERVTGVRTYPWIDVKHCDQHKHNRVKRKLVHQFPFYPVYAPWHPAYNKKFKWFSFDHKSHGDKKWYDTYEVRRVQKKLESLGFNVEDLGYGGVFDLAIENSIELRPLFVT